MPPVFTRDDMKPCANCGKGVMHSGLPLAWKLKVERVGINAQAIQREHGLEMMMGGNVALARVFSPERDFGTLLSSKSLILCEPCVMSALPPQLMMSMLSEEEG
jgi:hypothetical protein